MSTHLICEGPLDGLDVRVLDLVIAQKLRCDVLIEPAGGDSSLGSVATYIEGRYKTRAFAVEDRNYRSLDEADQTWQQPDRRRLIWRRHEIECYLLDPRLIADMFRSLRDTGVRGAGNLPGQDMAVLTLLQELARSTVENHAGWLTYWRLVASKNVDVNDTRLRRPDRDLAHKGDTPGSRNAWLSYLYTESLRLKKASTHLAAEPELDEASIISHYDEFLSQITQESFFESGQFLQDLGGHEMMSVLSQYISRSGVPRLSFQDLETELIKALDRLYHVGFYDPDDFAELAIRLRKNEIA